MGYYSVCFKGRFFRGAALVFLFFCASFLTLPQQTAKAANLTVIGSGGGGGAGNTGSTTPGPSNIGGGGGGGGGGSGDGANAAEAGGNGGNTGPALNNPTHGGGGDGGDPTSNSGGSGVVNGGDGIGGNGGSGGTGATGHNNVDGSGVGTAGSGGIGGAGGHASGTDASSAATNADSVYVIGGGGGGGGGRGGDGDGRDGGNGGDATLRLTSSQFEAAVGISVITGQAGDNGSGSSTGGAGGNAQLYGQYTTLYTPDLLVKNMDSSNGASATVEVGIFAVGRDRTTTIDLQGLGASSDEVYFHTLRFDLGVDNDLSVTSNTTQDIEFGKLYVDGLGHEYTHSLSGGAAIDLSYDDKKSKEKELTFFIRKDTVNGSVMLTVNNTAAAGPGTDANLLGANVRLNYCGAHDFYLGDTIALVQATDPDGIAAGDVIQANETVYSARGDKFYITQNAYGLYATFTALTPALISYAEGRAANHAFLTQGTDLVHNQGMSAAKSATQGFGISAFAAGLGGKSRYNTGSHVDVEGFNILAGLGAGADMGIGRLTAGLFFEAGWGGYDSYNSFSNIPDVHGDGDMSYYGGGVLLRYDITQGAMDGLYTEASFRMGRSEMDFQTMDIIHTPADFELTGTYYGAHLGLGYQWNVTEALMLDFSGKVMWTHQESDSVDVHHEHVEFEDTDSLRTRLGGRVSYAISDHCTPYMGAYWEYEFDSESKMKVNGSRVGYLEDQPSLEGSTGVGEIGFTFKPGPADSGFSVDLGAQGYVGEREGVSGSLRLNWEF